MMSLVTTLTYIIRNTCRLKQRLFNGALRREHFFHSGLTDWALNCSSMGCFCTDLWVVPTFTICWATCYDSTQPALVAVSWTVDGFVKIFCLAVRSFTLLLQQSLSRCDQGDPVGQRLRASPRQDLLHHSIIYKMYCGSRKKSKHQSR